MLDLQKYMYTVYAVMIPFLAMGTEQLAKRAIGEPGTGDNKMFDGDDETENDIHNGYSKL